MRLGDASRASRGGVPWAKRANCGRHDDHLAELRSGDPNACTLLSGGISRGQVSEHRSPAAVAPAARPGEVIDSLALDHPPLRLASAVLVMTAMQVRELVWGDPHHPTTPAELAKASGALLLQAIHARISALSRR